MVGSVPTRKHYSGRNKHYRLMLKSINCEKKHLKLSVFVVRSQVYPNVRAPALKITLVIITYINRSYKIIFFHKNLNLCHLMSDGTCSWKCCLFKCCKNAQRALILCLYKVWNIEETKFKKSLIATIISKPSLKLKWTFQIWK